MIVYFSQNSKKLYLKWLVGSLIFIIGMYTSFVWGRIQLLKVTTLQITRIPVPDSVDFVSKSVVNSVSSQVESKPFVASKRGKYYYPSNCSKVKALSSTNMLYFKDKMSAEAAGFKAYLGCK
jgi:hypothetical protein